MLIDQWELQGHPATDELAGKLGQECNTVKMA